MDSGFLQREPVVIPSSDAPGPFRRSWVLAAVVVLLWRAAALIWPSSLVVIPEAVRLPLGLLGLLFLICGVWAWWLRPGRWTAVFLIYGIGGGIHWGGTIDPTHAGLEISLLFVYLGFSALGEAGLLHLALIFPSGRSLKLGKRLVLYSIGTLALLTASIASLLSKAILEPLAGLIILIANLFSLVAGVLFLVALFRVDSATRRAARLPLIVTSMIGTFIVSTLGTEGILLAQSDAWNLFIGLVPISLAVALASPKIYTHLTPEEHAVS